MVKTVAIIGTGFGGLCMAIQLKKAGIDDFIIFEKGDTVGGTWRDNTYPGAACDVPSHLYSFSFEAKADWCHKYARQPEILAYLQYCAEKYDLLRHIHFNTEIGQAGFDEKEQHWNIETVSGELYTAQMVVFACGQLNRPLYPKLEGIEQFKGVHFHSARWDHGFDYTNKQIAVIGTGASAIQFVPELVKKAKQVYLFQRSAAWVIPKKDRPYSALEKKIFKRFHWIEKLYRFWIYWMSEIRFLALNPNGFIHRGLTDMAVKHIKKSVSDPVLQKALIPDYPAGCKRILISNNYYPALAQTNASVINHKLERVTEQGISAGGKEYKVDAIIYGTGFQSTDFLAPMRITGRKGIDLNEAWSKGAEAYLGITLADFPNLFMLYGPNTNLSHNSIIYMIESQVRYILMGIQAVKQHKLARIEPQKKVQQHYNKTLQDSLKNAIWSIGCKNWYVNKEGKNTNNWPGFSFQYRKRVSTFNLEDYSS